MFFYEVSRIFYRFLTIPWCNFVIFDFVIIFSMKFVKIVYIQSKYIKNQVVHYIGKLINRQSRAFPD